NLSQRNALGMERDCQHGLYKAGMGSSRVLSDFAEKYGSKNRVLAGFGIGGKSGKEKVYKLGCDRERLKMIKGSWGLEALALSHIDVSDSLSVLLDEVIFPQRSKILPVGNHLRQVLGLLGLDEASLSSELNATTLRLRGDPIILRIVPRLWSSGPSSAFNVIRRETIFVRIYNFLSDDMRL
ncbi:hypothetical protein Tco_1141915, partial [Tanacetum coccineum]